jgi:hypothetical protein
MVANRTREIRLSGMTRGAWGNEAYGGNVNPPRNRKGGSGNPPPKGRRAPALSRPQKQGEWDQARRLLGRPTPFAYAKFASFLDSIQIWSYLARKSLGIHNRTRKPKNIRNQPETTY